MTKDEYERVTSLASSIDQMATVGLALGALQPEDILLAISGELVIWWHRFAIDATDREPLLTALRNLPETEDQLAAMAAKAEDEVKPCPAVDRMDADLNSVVVAFNDMRRMKLSGGKEGSGS